MAELTDLDIYDQESIGLSSDFGNWLSTLVDIINENLTLLETSIADPNLHLTRVDTSATSNIELSDNMKDWLNELLDKIKSLESRIKVLEK